MLDVRKGVFYMKQSALEVLKRLFNESEDWILIVNEGWESVWSNRTTEIPDLRERLILPHDFWKNVVRPFVYCDLIYHCHVRCSCEDGLRVLQFQPALKGTFDFTTLSSLIQSMISACTVLYRELDEAGAIDLRPHLNSLVGDLLRIYRMMFMDMEFERGQRKDWETATFGLQAVIAPIYEECRNLMRHFACVDYECGEPAMFTRGDLRGFRCAVLSAMLMCIRQPALSQNIRISLHRENDHAALSFSVTPDIGKKRDSYIPAFDSENMLAEQYLLDQYCNAFDIRTEFSQTGDTVSCRMEIPLSAPAVNIQLNSSSGNADRGYFDLTPVMLARVHIRNYF